MSTLVELQDLAEDAFSFLLELGFRQSERVLPPNEGFRSGWWMTYEEGIRVEIKYTDWEFNVYFQRGGLRARYLDIDRELFANASRFQGDMFPPQKVGTAIQQIASDIRHNYLQILAGDESVWARLARLTPSSTKKRLP